MLQAYHFTETVWVRRIIMPEAISHSGTSPSIHTHTQTHTHIYICIYKYIYTSIYIYIYIVYIILSIYVHIIYTTQTHNHSTQYERRVIMLKCFLLLFSYCVLLLWWYFALYFRNQISTARPHRVFLRTRYAISKFGIEWLKFLVLCTDV